MIYNNNAYAIVKVILILIKEMLLPAFNHSGLPDLVALGGARFHKTVAVSIL